MTGLDFSPVLKAFPLLVDGLWLNVQLTALAATGGIVLGTLLAIARLSRSSLLRMAAAAYVDAFRALPILLVIFWFYFLVPLLLGRPVGSFASVLIGFTLFEAAYFCEIVRAGIQGLPAGQILAGKALGMTSFATMQHVILPQAFRAMLPVFLSQVIILFQDTSLVYVVGLYDIVTTSSALGSRDGRLVEYYIATAALLYAICSLATFLINRLASQSLVTGRRHG